MDPFPREGATAATNDATTLQAIQPLGVVSRDGRMGAGALDPRNDAIAITHEDGLAALHSPQVVAQTILELSNLYGDRGA